MRIYLDNCCFNRPFDDQTQVRIWLETVAKLRIQDRIARGELELVWSYILDYENAASPFEERRTVVGSWRRHAVVDVAESQEVLTEARKLALIGIHSKDALHVACAATAGCDVFLTTDDILLRKLSSYNRLRSVDPTTFVRETEL